ncbi:MAG: hypothetical protein VX546_13905 [Myxococcota bacterium]|nr:hypothetical protein [Myxococcota bacterium]
MESERRDDAPTHIELPAPTNSPLYFALGLALVMAGLVTNEIVSIVGGITAVLGAIGWWREVLPREHEIAVPVQSESERARPITPRPDGVEHMVAGRDGHRMRVPAAYHPYRSGLWGGAIGGIAMALVACAYGWIMQGSPWLPINLLAAMALPGIGAEGLESLKAFHLGTFLFATGMHAAISLSVGLVYAAVLPMLPGQVLLWGGIIAPAVWSGVAWAALGLVNPELDAHVSWPWFIASQVAFGLAAGAVIARSERVETLQSFPLATRAGIEAAGVSEGREEPE